MNKLAIEGGIDKEYEHTPTLLSFMLTMVT